MKPNILSIAFISLAGLVLSLPAQASYSWGLTATPASSTSGTSPSPYGNTKTYNGTGTPVAAPQLTASAWSDTGASKALQTAYLATYTGGLGVNNQIETTSVSSPDHAMDNNGNFDSIMFSFNSAISLEKVTIGWPSSSTTVGSINPDSDISVLAYVGSGAPTLSGKTYTGTSNSLLSAGWKWIGNYCDLELTGYANINAGGQSSSYWLIAAYNDKLGNTTNCTDSTGATKACGTSTSTLDYVKISGLAGSVKTPPPQPSGVPEPATLLLFGAGLLGFIRARST